MKQEEPIVRIKLKHKTQPKHHSVLEIVTHMVTGLATGVTIVYLFFPEIPLTSNLQAGLTITAVKFVINYFVRRYFANKDRGNQYED